MNIRCFMTGVQCRLDDSYVLNRRQARDLLDLLKDRAASLRRVMEQFSPLDDLEVNPAIPFARRARFAPKKHRLVCKAVADALAPGFPEIELFQSWSAYQSQARKIAQQGRRQTPEQPAKAALSNHENQPQP